MTNTLFKNEVVFLVPVFNEAKIIGQTIKNIGSVADLIICVNDGSTDDSSKKIRKTDAILIEHPINMGQGAAIQTGIEFALQFDNFKYFVTFDADGQHDALDAKKMLNVLKKENLDIVIGSRFLGEAINISLPKLIILKLAVMFTNLFSGVNLTDTHNGLRVFNRKFATALNIQMSGMAHASEIIDKIGQGNWRYKEVPVTITYSDYSRSRGQSILNSVNILVDILINRVKK